jgi:hypothetical protein
MVSGIRVVQSWLFSERVNLDTLSDNFKIVLGNVHRQGDHAFQEVAVSAVEVRSLNWLLVSSIFEQQKKPRPIYYAVSLVLDSDRIPATQEFMDVLISWARILAKVSKSLLNNNQPISSLKPVINQISDDIHVVLRAGIPVPPPIDISPGDANLFARLLTAHFHTQMTVVVESSSDRSEQAQQIAGFLSHFALPYQRQFSSLDVLPTPSPHLFIQCVEQQSVESHVDLMLRFDRPVTWVKLPDRRDGPVRIYKSKGSLETQKACHDSFIEAIFVYRPFADQVDLNRQLGEIREKYEVTDVTVPAPWVSARIALLIGMPEDSRSFFSATQFGAAIRAAISLVAIVHGRLAAGQGGTNEQIEKEIQSVLRLVGRTDLEMVLALARLYDKDIMARLSGQRTSTMRSFSGFLTARRT